MKKKILIIEDDTAVRENVSEMLDLAGFEVIDANNGRDGVKLAINEKPSLIICDILMPGLDGYSVFAILNKNEITQGTPFIFLTATQERSNYRKAMDMGADDYLTKPFDDFELLRTIYTRLDKNVRQKNSFPKIPGVSESLLLSANSLDEYIISLDKREKITFRRKEFIYSEGNKPRGMYYIHTGNVKVYLSNEEGKGLLSDMFSDGQFFGYIPLIENSHYTDSAVATAPTILVFIPAEELFLLLNNNIRIASEFIKILSGNSTEKEARLIKLAYNSVRKRVAETLMYLLKRNHSDQPGELTVSVQREDLASLAGTALETVVRTLSDFKEEKIISINGSTITILDESKLANMRN